MTVGLKALSEVPIHDATGVQRYSLRVADDFSISLVRHNSSGVPQTPPVLIIDGTTGSIQPGSGLLVSGAGTSSAPAADAAVALLNTTGHIALQVNSAANTAISTTSSYEGQVISLRANSVAGGGSYTLAVTGGTLTLNSTGEAAVIKRIGGAWIVLALTASSSTVANIATIV